MNTSRRSSVYDLSALRLHPDGSKVHQTSDNLTLGKHKNVKHLPRRGWIAEDAGGSCKIPLHRPKRKRQLVDDDEEGGSGNGKAGETGEDDNTLEKMPKKKKGHRVRHRRSKKKIKFHQDDSYIPETTETASEAKDNEPPPDLLKLIHYHASSFYKLRGTLSNAPRKYHRKANKEQFKQLVAAPEGEQESDDECGDDHSSMVQDDVEVVSVESPRTPTSARAKRDMYHVFGGSLLLGMGVLAQEKASQLLESKLPPPINQHTATVDNDSEVEFISTRKRSDLGDECQAMEEVAAKKRVRWMEEQEVVDLDKEWKSVYDVISSGDNECEERSHDNIIYREEEAAISDIRDYWTEVCDESDGTNEVYTTEEEIDEIDSDE